MGSNKVCRWSLPTLPKVAVYISVAFLLVLGWVYYYGVPRIASKFQPRQLPESQLTNVNHLHNNKMDLPESQLTNVNHLHNNTMDFLVYHPPINPSISGKFFKKVSKTILENLLPEPVMLDANSVKDVIFVTAVSKKFYPRMTLLAQSIQQYFPTYKLIVYDLGLTKDQRLKMQLWCHVEVRKFDFKKYPPHVQVLHNYAFKPIVISDAMKRYNTTGVFWVDSSIRFLRSNITLYHKISLRSKGVTAFTVNHSVFSVTPPKMFEYLPSIKDSSKTVCIMATSILLYKTEPVIDHIMHWWVACALSPTCIYSFKSRFCSFGKNRWTYFAHCSRYDQAALSILLHNAFYDSNLILGPNVGKERKGIMCIQRGGSGGQVRACKDVNNTHEK